MPDFGPLFSALSPSEPRKLVKEPTLPAGDRVVIIDGKEATINWTSHEGTTAMGEYYEAGISFNRTDHSVWKIRRNLDGSWEAIRCLLYGRQNLSEDELELARKYTRKV